MSTPYTDETYLLPPPYRMENMDVIGFLLNGKAHNIQQLLNRHLNVAGNTTYMTFQEAALKNVIGDSFPLRGVDQWLENNPHHPILVTFHHIDRLYAVGNIGGESLRERGYVTYNEVVFWLPVLGVEQGIEYSPLHLPSLRLYVPLILANDPLAVAGGREIFGLPKRFGTIQIPPLTINADNFDFSQHLANQPLSVQTSVLTQYSADTASSMDDILKIQFGSASPTSVSAHYSDESFARKLVEQGVSFFSTMEHLPLFGQVVERFVQGVSNVAVQGAAHALKIVALKQFRFGQSDYLEACYQSANQMIFTLEFQQGHIIHGLEIDVTTMPFANISLASMLGLESQTTGLAFYIRLNGELSGHLEQRTHP